MKTKAFRLVLASCFALVLTACGLSQKAAEARAASDANLKAGQAFLAANAKAQDVTSTASGLQYKIIRSGPADGLRPKPQDEIKVNYEGKLLSGKVFDSSYARGVPAAFPLGSLVPCWVEALQLMRPGDEWTVWCPSSLAYGEQDMGGGEIPGNSVLEFRLELISVLPHPGSVQRG